MKNKLSIIFLTILSNIAYAETNEGFTPQAVDGDPSRLAVLVMLKDVYDPNSPKAKVLETEFDKIAKQDQATRIYYLHNSTMISVALTPKAIEKLKATGHFSISGDPELTFNSSK